MSIHPHPAGGFRLCKKISGREYQFYSRNPGDLIEKEAELNALAALKPVPIFWADGRMRGVSVGKERRADRPKTIFIRVQIGEVKKQIKYSGSFEELWRETCAIWKEARNLLPLDVVAYSDEMRLAKIYYMDKVRELEAEAQQGRDLNLAEKQR